MTLTSVFHIFPLYTTYFNNVICTVYPRQIKSFAIRIIHVYETRVVCSVQNLLLHFAVKPYILDGERLEIEFNRIAYNQREDPRLIFGFQPLVAYFDDDYDFVVLELRSYDAGVPYPPALTCFADVSVSEIHLVGHPGGRQMKEDIVDPKWSPVHDKEIIPYIEGLAGWSIDYFPDKKDYYSILLEPPRKIMFDTTFDTGSSGSPGVIIRNNKPCVVLMVRGGTPSCFYENYFPDKKVEDHQKIEYGYAMADIFRKMWESSQQNIKDLASEIFREWY